jgi:hypothetical protein
MNIKGNPCGPDSVFELRYTDDRYSATLTITPLDSGGADMRLTGKIPPEIYIPSDDQTAVVSSIKEMCQVIAQVLTNACPPDISGGYILTPGYVPDSDKNAKTLFYPCGSPRGEHWHPIPMDEFTGQIAKETVKETLGDHSQKSLGKLIYKALKHTWPDHIP